MKDNFAYFNKPITECSDKELISFYIAFCNGADLNNEQDKKDYSIFKAEIPNRSSDFQSEIILIDSIL